MGDMFLPHLLEGNCNERVCVRVARFWDFFDPQDDTKLLHTNMVLIDEEGNTMHAQIYPAASEQFKQLVKEGNVYTFCYFRVKKSGGYKPVENDRMLTFTKWTKVEEMVHVPPAFPMHVYSLASMEQIQSHVDSRVCFTDVIGVITAISNVESIRTRVRQGESLRRPITIRIPSGDLLNVVLWAERASSFPVEDIHRDGQTSPQIVIFVGTLVRSYGGVSLSGSSSCKWYINPEVPEAKKVMASAKAMHQPITWAENMNTSGQRDAAEDKKDSDIIALNPFECKNKEFLVTVTIKKIDKSWWYNACKKCTKSTKRHADSYKCNNPKCSAIGMPTQRYKLSILAGDETTDTDFIIFGRVAQRIIKKSADTLIADNPIGFIPDEITRLLEKTFIWNVSFTDNTIDSGNIRFQVNGVVAEIGDDSVVIPATPTGSQTSSLVLSRGASTSMQHTPQKSNPLTLSSLPAASEASLASSTTPSKIPMPTPQPPETPQGGRNAIADEEQTESPGMHGDDSNKTPKQANISAAAPVGSSTTKTRKSTAKKRSRPSPDQKVAKKLFNADNISPSKNA